MENLKRPKISIPEQVQYMQSKGIGFNIITPDEAGDFLQQSNYYFKVKAYEKNYVLAENNKYVDLEFAYLVELSKLDYYLRKHIIQMSLDVEHYLKVLLLKDISQNSKEDGYSIVEKFLSFKPDLSKEIKDKGKNSTCADLIDKYHEHYAVWHFVEVISFRYFIEFFEYYYRINDRNSKFYGRLLPVKFLRNAAAHNNCLINCLDKRNDFEVSGRMLMRVDKIPTIAKKSATKQMSNRIVHDFTALCSVYYDAASPISTVKLFEQLKEFFDKVCTRNKDFFATNSMLLAAHSFAKKVVDHYYELSMTKIEKVKRY